MENVDAKLARLERHEAVTGLIRYGADHQADGYSVGDYDLFVVFSSFPPPIEGLHFDVGHTPVDPSFITLKGLQGLVPTFSFAQLALRNRHLRPDGRGRARFGAAETVRSSARKRFQSLRSRLFGTDIGTCSTSYAGG